MSRNGSEDFSASFVSRLESTRGRAAITTSRFMLTPLFMPNRPERLNPVFWRLVLSAWNGKSTIPLPFYFMEVLLEFDQ